MLAVLASLIFPATLWLIVVLLARMVEDSGAKIAAALRPQPALSELRGGSALRFSPRVQPVADRLTQVRPQLRAAA